MDVWAGGTPEGTRVGVAGFCVSGCGWGSVGPGGRAGRVTGWWAGPSAGSVGARGRNDCVGSVSMWEVRPRVIPRVMSTGFGCAPGNRKSAPIYRGVPRRAPPVAFGSRNPLSRLPGLVISARFPGLGVPEGRVPRTLPSNRVEKAAREGESGGGHRGECGLDRIPHTFPAGGGVLP